MKEIARKDLQNYIENEKERMLDELFALLRIPSISAVSAHRDDMRRMADALVAKLLASGADRACVMETGCHPAVMAEKMLDPALPTVLVYGHYDVQPVEPLELWKNPPFDPIVRKTDLHPEGAILARGANDDKGQMYMHVLAFEYMMRSGTLPCNVKFLIEGEEEAGSSHLDAFVRDHARELACDVVLVSDTTMAGKDQPSVMTGLRGLSYFEVTVKGPSRDLHSGHFGGAVVNPCTALCEMIAALHDEAGRIAIPHFYDDVQEVSPQERQQMNALPLDMERYKANVGVSEVNGEEGYNTRERATIRPALDINGIWGGYTGEGAKTILPAQAHAKISIRLVPNQDPEKVNRAFVEHFKSLAPRGVEVEVVPTQGAYPYVTPVSGRAYQAAAEALTEVYGRPTVPVRGGGSIGVVPMFEKYLGRKTILMGFGLDTDAIHSPNENYSLAQFYRGIESIVLFYRNFCRK